MSINKDESWAVIKKLDTVKDYKTCAHVYDEIFDTLSYSAPNHVARAVNELLGNKKDALILDAGAGTGLVGKELHDLGFTNLDALDGSQEMLNIANQKGVYKRTICDLLGTNRLDISNDTYSCVLVVGTIVPGHANASCLPELIRITKPGGFVVITTRDVHVQGCGHAGKSLAEWMGIHEKNKLWRKMETKRVENYLDGHAGSIDIFQVV
ncbi:methyltransferase-like protein 27 [Lingula anatina]|uniref:Methyltransferase-like protein 27 n=1 Tax=Lingula anatina TaxID=7574 RepID=A0A1S3IBH3_LINAN|nr:methyltransferase-like protein 27 [Lingula anatina]|eukprot:XP_013395610.1 methyltransferase-like protein 27 [Lingula anatina]